MSDIKIAENFPHSALTPLATDQAPSYYTLSVLHQEISANAISVESDRGDGIQGHYALVETPARYLLATNNIPFIRPVHPGVHPVHVVGTTQFVITEVNRQYAADLAEFRAFNSVEAALKKLVIAAVPLTFIQILQHPIRGFAAVTTLEILTHLNTRYGTVKPSDITANVKAMERAWSPTVPLDDLWHQIRLCQLFASTIEPIPDAMAIRSILENLENSGVFTQAIYAWRQTPPATWTMPAVVLHFTIADDERKRQLTAQAAGYQGAALAATTSPPSPAKSPTKIAPIVAPTKATNHPNNMYYCWSHGYGPNRSHTSATCTNCLTGHQKEATITNMMGGINTIHRRKGETQIAVRIPRNPTA